MSQQLIDLTGIDNLPTGGAKINDNFTEVYASFISTGVVVPYVGTTAPSGWVLLVDGLNIGNASSGASGRANADTANLFALLWNSFANAQASVSSGRGASAAADFAANKTIELPRVNGKALVGKSSSGSFTTLGDYSLGSETHTLTESELPIVADHTHEYGIYNGSGGVGSASAQGVTDGASNYPSTDANGGFGGGSAHNNIQPSIALNMIIKL